MKYIKKLVDTNTGNRIEFNLIGYKNSDHVHLTASSMFKPKYLIKKRKDNI